MGGVTTKTLITHLQIFAGARLVVILFTKNGAHIGIARLCSPFGHMGLHHGHGKVWPQHHLAQQRVSSDIGPRTDIFAVKIKQAFSRQQNIGVDHLRPCRLKGCKQILCRGAYFVYISHWPACPGPPPPDQRAPPRAEQGVISILPGWHFRQFLRPALDLLR